MKSPLPETLSYCRFAGRWIIAENPKKCLNDYDCNNCEYYEKRSLTKYIIKKLRKLERENNDHKI